MHTLKEAGDMICPSKRIFCSADECMAWRWVATRRRKNGATAHLVESHEDIPVAERKGYCGLAGKPQED